MRNSKKRSRIGYFGVFGTLALVMWSWSVQYAQPVSADIDPKGLLLRVKMESLVKSIGAYRTEHGSYPQNLSELVCAKKKYCVEEATLSDIWGNLFVYQYLKGKKECMIITLGADGKPGGDTADTDVKIKCD